MAMHQLVLLSITVGLILEDIMFWGEGREQIEEGGRHGEVYVLC